VDHRRVVEETMIEAPPPMLGNGRVLGYAIVDESVTYSGHSSLFVGTAKDGLQELGPVPCLAITKDLKTGEIALLHCDEGWDLLGTGGNYASVEQAKRSAERAYHGIAARWVDAQVTEEEALKYRDEVWADERCSFCGKIPPDFNMLIKHDNARICDSCIEDFHQMVEEHRAEKK
jgi:ClpX C4-type zinc finger protein